MFQIYPPGVKDSWEEMDIISQSSLLAYSELRQIENAKAGHV